MVFAYSSFFAFPVRSGRMSPLLLWLLLLAQVEANNQSHEVQALLEFKATMEQTLIIGWVISPDGTFEVMNGNGGYWSSWKETDENPCAWVGVSCSNKSTVEELDLSGWGLESLPGLGALSTLMDLHRLDLSSNDIHAEIPGDIQTLTSLTYLDLSKNQFGDSIPTNISACGRLQYISLDNNKFTGEIPSLQGLVNLQVLRLADNRLIGPFPKDLEEISTLVSIDLSDNMLNGTVPSLSKLVNLLELKLDNNNFTQFDGALFPGAKSLERLSLSGNQLEGIIPPGITNLLNLKFLNLSRNLLSSTIPLGFSQQLNKSAYSLDLSQNQLTGEITVDLLQPTTFPISLNLSHNLLSGNIPFYGPNPYRYVFLDLSHNSLSGLFPSMICKNNETQIALLLLNDNLLSGDIVDSLVDCRSLEQLTVLRCGNNLFTGDLSRLAGLSVNVHPLRFVIVDLANNNLRMRPTNVTLDPLKGVLEFFLNNAVIELRLGGNNFSGTSLPRDLSFNTSINLGLRVLDLSNSDLTGQISSAVFNDTWFETVQYLNLSNNDIVGPIPQTIVTLPDLAVLDVSNNSLSGPLPFIAPNSKLYNPSFFVGNDRLCGYPLSSCPQGSRTGVQWWVLLIIVGGSLITAFGSCLGATWQWKAYHKRHQQDADLIKTLLERESATLMSLWELKKATDNFAENAQIGEGGFGTVYVGTLNDGTMVAIKRSKQREETQKDKDQFLNEVRILSQVNHRHLVKLLGCCMENKVSLLVFEYISNGTLQEHLQGKVGTICLSWKQRLKIAIQTADALNYLHSATTYPIYHRDVKSANILLNHDLNAKVADFGISKLAPVEDTHVSTIAVQGTIGYIDPEYYTSYRFTNKSDVYSFGVVLLELISAKPAIDARRGGDNISLVNFAKLHIERGDLQQFIDPTLTETYMDPANHGSESIMNVGRLAVKCVDMQSKARPDMNEVWNKLQSLWLELDGTPEKLEVINEDDNQGRHLDRTILLSESF